MKSLRKQSWSSSSPHMQTHLKCSCWALTLLLFIICDDDLHRQIRLHVVLLAAPRSTNPQSWKRSLPCFSLHFGFYFSVDQIFMLNHILKKRRCVKQTCTVSLPRYSYRIRAEPSITDTIYQQTGGLSVMTSCDFNGTRARQNDSSVPSKRFLHLKVAGAAKTQTLPLCWPQQENLTFEG